MTRSLRIAVADDEPETRQYLQELLTHLGHQVVGAGDGKQLTEQCKLLQPDLIITDIRMPDVDGIAAAEAVNRERPTPVILLTGHHDPEYLRRAQEGPIMAYLVKPVKPPDVEAAVAVAMARFEQHQATRREAADLRQALEDRKVVERAKGALMKRLQVDEAEAFRRLRKLASDQNRKLVEVSRTVLEAEKVFHDLDRPAAP
jgi:two-component system, response regulator PdtaR